jgi:hypothetical protein
MTQPVVPAALKHGPFTLVEARREGLTRRQLRSSVWRPLGGGLYAWAGLDDGPALALAAIQRRLPAEAAFSGPTAAWLHGLDLPPCDPIEVTIPDGCGVSARAGLTVRRAALRDGEVVQRRGIRATSALRTVVDLSHRLPLIEAVVAADMALHKRLLDLGQIRACIAAHRGRKGIIDLRRVAELAEPAAESPMETRLRLLLVLAGLPRPEAQVPLYDAEGHFLARPDLYYRAARLCVEYDGSSHRERLVEDNRRQNALVNAGFRLLRFTAADVLRTPSPLVQQVRAALAGPSAGE